MEPDEVRVKKNCMNVPLSLQTCPETITRLDDGASVDQLTHPKDGDYQKPRCRRLAGDQIELLENHNLHLHRLHRGLLASSRRKRNSEMATGHTPEDLIPPAKTDDRNQYHLFFK